MRGSRRSLSEVIGALVVLAVVMVALVSMIRLSSKVLSATEAASTQDFVRSAQEAEPPVMSVLVRNSTLYMLVTYPSRINITYAVLNVSGRLVVERLDYLVQGQALIPLLGNYSCQNVSIWLVSSSGAVFRYLPYEDPLLRGRVSPSDYYFSCALLNSSAAQAPAGQAAQQALQPPAQVVYAGGDSFEIGDYLVLAGMDYGKADPERLGAVEVGVNASGAFSVLTSGGQIVPGSWRFSVRVNGTYVRGVVGSPPAAPGSRAINLTRLGEVELYGVPIYVYAYVFANRTGPSPVYGVGVALVSPGLLANLSGAVNVSGIFNPCASGSSMCLVSYGGESPGAAIASLMGLWGNFTSRSSTYAYSVYENVNFYVPGFAYNSSARGYAVTDGPLTLMYTVAGALPGVQTTFKVNATLRGVLYAYAGQASLDVAASGPVSASLVEPSLASYSSVRQYVAVSTLGGEQYFNLTFSTPYGNFSRLVGPSRGLTFVAPYSLIAIRSPEPPGYPINTTLSYSYSWNSSAQQSWEDKFSSYTGLPPLLVARAEAWASAAEPLPSLVPALLNLTFFGRYPPVTLVVVPPDAQDSAGLRVDGVYEAGPVVAAPCGSNISAFPAAALANATLAAGSLDVGGSYEYLTGPWSYLRGCGAGVGLLWTGDGRLYVLITS